MQYQVLAKESNQPYIFIAIPNMNDMVTPLWFRLLHWCVTRRYNLYLYAPMNQIPHDRPRNMCHKQFLTRTDYDYIYWQDADLVPPYNALDLLVGYDKNIVSLTQPLVRLDETGAVFEPQALKRHEEDGEVYFTTHYGKGLEPVDATNIACCLIKRQVMEDVGPGAFDFEEKAEGDGWNIARWGEDLYFARKYIEAGYQAWNDFGTVCTHWTHTNTAVIEELIVNAIREHGENTRNLEQLIQAINQNGGEELERSIRKKISG